MQPASQPAMVGRRVIGRRALLVLAVATLHGSWAVGSLLDGSLLASPSASEDADAALWMSQTSPQTTWLSPPPLPSPPEVPTLPPLRLYDCNAEYEFWETLWTPDWKAWCCEHESRGCTPTPAPVQASSSTSTSTGASTRFNSTIGSKAGETPQTCGQDCELGGRRTSCAEQMRWAYRHQTANASDACKAAYEWVAARCQACESCAPVNVFVFGSISSLQDLQSKALERGSLAAGIPGRGGLGGGAVWPHAAFAASSLLVATVALVAGRRRGSLAAVPVEDTCPCLEPAGHGQRFDNP